jgi:hypothetical protein
VESPPSRQSGLMRIRKDITRKFILNRTSADVSSYKSRAHPLWTAVGVCGLFSVGGVLEDRRPGSGIVRENQ